MTHLNGKDTVHNPRPLLKRGNSGIFVCFFNERCRQGVKISNLTCRRGYSEKANDAITEILSRKEPLKRNHIRMIVKILFSETPYPDYSTLWQRRRQREKCLAANFYLHSCNHVYLLGISNELPIQSYLHQKVVDWKPMLFESWGDKLTIRKDDCDGKDYVARSIVLSCHHVDLLVPPPHPLLLLQQPLCPACAQQGGGEAYSPFQPMERCSS